MVYILLTKKIIKIVSFIIFAGSTFFMCATSARNISFNSDSNDHYGLSLNQSLVISENELLQKKLGALNGDPDAAFKLMIHFAYGMADDFESIKWSIIAAENGHNEGMYFLANDLLYYSDGDGLKIRGVFWLYLMAKNNYRETLDWLKDIGYSLESAQPPSNDLFPDYYTNLSEIEISKCKIGALQGNKKAAWILGKYYSEIKMDNELLEYWYRIGAQNGDTECQYKLGQIMSDKENIFEKIRGGFWLNQAIKNGYDKTPANSN